MPFNFKRRNIFSGHRSIATQTFTVSEHLHNSRNTHCSVNDAIIENVPSDENKSPGEKTDHYLDPPAPLYPGVLQECHTDTKLYLQNVCEAHADIRALT